MSKSNSSLRPGWFKGSGAGGGKGFQPPPTASDRGDKGRSNSTGSGGDNESGSRKDSNIFAALLDDDDGTGSGVGDGNGIVHASESSSNPPPVINSSRSEAFRSSFNRASSSGSRRSLADLAARVPESAPALGSHGSRRHTSHNSAFDGPKGGAGGSGRFSHAHAHDGGSAGGHGGSIESYKPDPKVVRYTREKLLSLRFAPRGEDPGPPDELKPLEGSVVISATVQDPVCWDTFDAEEIWEMAREQRRAAAVTAGKPIGALEGGGGEQRSRRPAPSSGRWSRGLALPPPEEGNRRKGDADNPNELWDDPIGGVTGAASDFSSFGALPPEDGVGGGGGGGGNDAFDFDKMTEASAKIEKELHGNKESDSEEEQNAKKMVDVSRPLASAGTTLVSGSGNGVNVFEDFDAPNVSDNDAKTRVTGDKKEVTVVRGGDEDPSASSRLMQMIGVSRDPANDQANNNAEPSSNPWGSSASANDGPNNTTTSDPIIGGNSGGASISLNPWGDPIVPASASSEQTAGSGGGMNLGGIHLRPFSAEEKNLEAQRLSERGNIARQEAEMLARRRQEEEEAKRRTLAQQQQAPPQQSQIELVLMERICTILENSWGRNDLVSILTTLHTEDSRVVPLLGNIDALRALIARSPQRVNLRRDPGLAGEMAVLVMTNTQWQEQQQIQARIQQEELRRRQLEEEAKARLQAQNQLAASIKKDAPWFYSDPQNNIQGPFRGEEMRQWLEAGYFKGDLPISQVSSGPFHQLSNWFPDLSAAFVVKESGGQDDADIAAAKEQQRKDAEAAANAERQRLAEVVELQRKAEADANVEAKRGAEEASAARALEGMNVTEMQAPVNGGNQSSAQLKLMLGLSSGEQPATESKITEAVDGTKAAKKANAKSSKTSSKKVSQKNVDKSQAAPQPEPETQPIVSESVPPPVPAALAAPAWGGIAKSKPRKSMSEIQQEEARAAAALAAKRGNMPQPSSSGWANVAAGSTGSTGWSTTAIRSSSSQNAAPVTSVRPGQAPSKPQTKKVATSIQHARSAPVSSSTPAEEFGATMSPALEKWCKEKMQQINGSNDLTLVAFCMTLNDASEIRQYLTTYLGSTMQVNNFATEFINKRGLGSKQEEWETPGSAKKGRKKKSGR